MNRRPCLGARRPTGGCALTPRHAGSWATPARHTARQASRSSTLLRLSYAMSLRRRVLTGVRESYKFHRPTADGL
jgi:hypothetical protein